MSVEPPSTPVPAQLLIVDDDEALLRATCTTLNRKGFVAVGCERAAAAIEQLRARHFDLLLADLQLPDADGIKLLQQAHAIRHDVVGVLMTGYATVDTAVAAMKGGALDVILKPFTVTHLLAVVERALAMRRLRREREALERRVAERTRELEIANADLDAFAEWVSHDLRAPAGAVAKYSQIILEQAAPRLAPLHVTLLHHIRDSAADMTALIEGLLRFARFGRAPLRLEVVPVMRLVREVVDQVSDHHPDRLVEVVIDDLPDCVADIELLRHVLVNLVANAFKYTGKTAAARIEIGAVSEAAGIVYFVRDNGAGFDEQLAPRLFAPFQRLHPASEFEGTGVGLSIALRIVERHGGRIWAHGAVGLGATFYVFLPFV